MGCMTDRSEAQVHQDIKDIIYTQDVIAQRVKELGAQITADYQSRMDSGERLVAVCLLRGASLFMADLVREVKLPLEFDFMVISSYGDGTTSSGMIRIQKDLSSDIAGAHVLIIEDIIDSGLTLSYLCKNLLSRDPASLEIASLLRKDVENQADVECRYVGFECPNEFIVGYGLDYAQRYRNLPYIGTLKREVYEDE